MDISDLYQSCRKGDLNRVKYLVEHKEVDLNIRDKWDSTPLYYACLCGHKEVAQYLLENGARCEANTFDGERCLYGALNMEIRNLLRNFKVVTAKSLRRDSYDEFLRRCLEVGDYWDVSFVVHGETIMAHRCILCSRCEYFANMFHNKWRNRDVIHISHPRVTPLAFMTILQYLYTGRLETHMDFVEDCIIVAKQCQLLDLIEELEESVKSVKSFECTKPGTNVTTLLVESGIHSLQLQQDLGVLAYQALPPELSNWVGGSELPFLPHPGYTCLADLCINVRGHIFTCHKVFFCGRSDYFRALLSDHFEETMHHPNDSMTITLHDISIDVFLCILHYMYRNNAELALTTAYDVLCAADLYLLPGLKRQCANFIGQHLDVTSVVPVLRSARLFELPRLEDQCAEFMAKHLDEVIGEPDFHALVKEDAKDVMQRQETDSIGVVDDIRYHITGSVQTFSAMAEANEKLQLIDDLLENLGLDA